MRKETGTGWFLTGASEPVRTLDPYEFTNSELREARQTELAAGLVKLQGLEALGTSTGAPDALVAQRVVAKGILVRAENGTRLNIAALSALGGVRTVGLQRWRASRSKRLRWYMHGAGERWRVRDRDGACRSVYCLQQAERESAIFDAHCAQCHEGPDVDGPPLAGRPFIDRWREDALAGLFDFIKIADAAAGAPDLFSTPTISR
jgi:hypothetical protein